MEIAIITVIVLAVWAFVIWDDYKHPSPDR